MKVIPLEGSSGLEGLAQQIELDQVDAANDQAQGQQSEQEAHALHQLDLGMAKLTMGVFKALRAILARKLPELRDEWSDSTLQAPADALVPVIKRYLKSLMTRLADAPELAVFAMSVIPLVLGYMDALERHEKTISNAVSSGQTGAAQSTNDGAAFAG